MNKLKTLIVVILLTMVPVGCTEGRKPTSECGKGDCKSNPKRSTIEYHTLNGVPLECVGLLHRLSCNWEKYNRLVDACEASSKERRTVVTKEGETLIFPAVKGEC